MKPPHSKMKQKDCCVNWCLDCLRQIGTYILMFCRIFEWKTEITAMITLQSGVKSFLLIILNRIYLYASRNHTVNSFSFLIN